MRIAKLWDQLFVNLYLSFTVWNVTLIPFGSPITSLEVVFTKSFTCPRKLCLQNEPFPSFDNIILTTPIIV